MQAGTVESATNTGVAAAAELEATRAALVTAQNMILAFEAEGNRTKAALERLRREGGAATPRRRSRRRRRGPQVSRP